MDSEIWAIFGLASALLGLFVALMLVGLSADSSGWSTYEQNGKSCITLTRQENHIFSPDKTYVDNWCK